MIAGHPTARRSPFRGERCRHVDRAGAQQPAGPARPAESTSSSSSRRRIAIYTVFSIYPARRYHPPQPLSGDDRRRPSSPASPISSTFLTDPAWSAPVLERASQQSRLLPHPHGGAERDRPGACRAAEPARGSTGAQRLPHADLPADDAVRGDHRLHLAAHAQSALGHCRNASRAVGLGRFFAPWLGQESTALMTVSLISVWQFVGIPMMLIYAALLNIPDDLVDAATVDGAGPFSVFWFVQAAADPADARRRLDPDLRRQLQRLRSDLRDEGRARRAELLHRHPRHVLLPHLLRLPAPGRRARPWGRPSRPRCWSSS